MNTNQTEPNSPLLANLREQLRKGDFAALELFWQAQKATGTPLIEPMKGDKLLVTFLYRNQNLGNHVLLLGTPANLDSINHRLLQMEGTDLWYLTFLFPKDLRTLYGFLPSAPELLEDFAKYPRSEQLGTFFNALLKHAMADPLNPKPYIIPENLWLNPEKLVLSSLELPEAPLQPWVQSASTVSKGALHAHLVNSSLLGNERNVWVYTSPNAYAQSANKGLLILFDGDAYTRFVHTATILDNLIHAKKIPPMTAIFIDNPDDPTRDRELGCNPLMLEFLSDELLPNLAQEYEINLEPSTTVIAGSSYGGLAAFYAGLKKSHLFGNVISLSGHLGWGAENGVSDKWIIEQYAEIPRLPIQMYLSVGSLETGPPTFNAKPSFIDANRSMRDLLQQKGYRFRYTEYSGGHDYFCWQQELAEGLIFLLEGF